MIDEHQETLGKELSLLISASVGTPAPQEPEKFAESLA